jgi:hypothetical protein
MRLRSMVLSLAFYRRANSPSHTLVGPKNCLIKTRVNFIMI